MFRGIIQKGVVIWGLVTLGARWGTARSGFGAFIGLDREKFGAQGESLDHDQCIRWGGTTPSRDLLFKLFTEVTDSLPESSDI
jgi:hypothetical protein